MISIFLRQDLLPSLGSLRIMAKPRAQSLKSNKFCKFTEPLDSVIYLVFESYTRIDSDVQVSITDTSTGSPWSSSGSGIQQLQSFFWPVVNLASKRLPLLPFSTLKKSDKFTGSGIGISPGLRKGGVLNALIYSAVKPSSFMSKKIGPTGVSAQSFK